MGLLRILATASILGALLSLIHPDAWKLNTRLRPVEPGDAVLVTGASSGIGRHAALSLAKEGFTVYAGVRRADDGEKLRSLAAELGLDVVGEIKVLLLDVTKSEDIRAAMRTISDDVGARGLRGIFCNAGVAKLGPAEDHSRTTFQEIMDINFHGSAEIAVVFLDLLRAGKGTLILNSSVAGMLGIPYLAAYSASKFALEGFADSFRREVRHTGVKVVVLECGLIKTEIWRKNAIAGALKEDPRYPEWHKHQFKSFAEVAEAPGPTVSSEAIVHAMRAAKPETRYLVGGQTGLAFKVGLKLPDAWLDFLLSADLEAVDVPADGIQGPLASIQADAARGFEL